MASRFRWYLRLSFGIASVIVPLLAFAVGGSLVNGEADDKYFEAVAQILPVLLLALAVEQRYFDRKADLPAGTPEGFDEALQGFAKAIARLTKVYAVIVVVFLAYGEETALRVLGTGHSDHGDLSATAGSLAAGFAALIISALVRPGDPRSAGSTH